VEFLSLSLGNGDGLTCIKIMFDKLYRFNQNQSKLGLFHVERITSGHSEDDRCYTIFCDHILSRHYQSLKKIICLG
jgi:hypothetical protein